MHKGSITRNRREARYQFSEKVYGYFKHKSILIFFICPQQTSIDTVHGLNFYVIRQCVARLKIRKIV